MNRAEAAKLARAARAAKQPSLHDRFWSKVAKRGPDECWLWTAALRTNIPPKNYGAFWMNGRHHPSSRIALIFSGVEVAAHEEVCHKCDNPPCCNPAHLFVGTLQDNMDDKVAKGRQVRGVRCHTAKLTEDQAREILALKTANRTPSGYAKKIAEKYGITPQYVSEIWARKSWRLL